MITSNSLVRAPGLGRKHTSIQMSCILMMMTIIMKEVGIAPTY